MDKLVAFLSGIGLTVAGLFALIPVLRKLKFGQTVREDGPQSHLAKTGTPTMGGCIFLLVIPLAVRISGEVPWEGAMAIGLIWAMGALGFLDDFLKIRRRHADGLRSRQKMAGQILISTLFAAAFWWMRGGRMWIPFVNIEYDFQILFIPIAAFIIIATGNGVNFTDGIDGLCSGVTAIIAMAFVPLSVAWRMPLIGRLSAALLGSCMGFLFFNRPPAKVFMGDTGSLSLGAAVAALALLTDTALMLPLLGVVYMAEVLSVILQVRYFKMTGGKRLFRMSPIHHHFELSGWSEIRINVMFYLVTFAAAAAFLWIVV
ncbi:MAG: phospho-N-acetylmuramoyl-pentapeptide-transferase [Clostridiales bacterium]|nr:phospho-N-acetylmuramoyl-pentapeptide-transferase [Clostridiales bacterium]